MTVHKTAPRKTEYDTSASDALAPLVHARPDKPYVIAQLGQSLDGRIATPSGASRWINRDCALDHVHRIRAHVDAVVIGMGTVLADDPLLTVRRVKGPQPARVVLDPDGRLNPAARVLNPDGVRCFVASSSHHAVPSRAEAIVLKGSPLFDPNAIIAELFRRGLRKILVEGGAATVSSFVGADAVDRLHVLVAPVILGSGMPGLSLKPIGGLDEARRPATRVHVLDDGDVLFDCDLRRSA